jgi:pimeloyl-ACP methyl ester carboxylesterase
VYVNAFAPEPGETCFALAGMFPGSQLGETTLRPVANSDGSTDLFIKLGSFHEVFCPDLSDEQAARMAVTQRPATQEALVEPSGAKSLWKELPSWFLIGEQDHVIPAALQDYMAKRTGAHRVLEIPGASHAALVSHPNETAHLILEATTAHVAA